ncbi:hypothetical protein [Enterovibrio norvegicus]|uniref:hypothetical protein n=1 Tax=Enterovibrio norvegicus TaxID=188144 RepID=UPI000C862238|nr:hypothetical protein [Enterovibrio norvegicus]PMI30205.1 hypothetical protein BCU47_18655 [Enterovibrio norvegicus]
MLKDIIVNKINIGDVNDQTVLLGVGAEMDSLDLVVLLTSLEKELDVSLVDITFDADIVANGMTLAKFIKIVEERRTK